SALPEEVTGGLPTQIAAWLFLPDDLSLLGPRPVSMVLLAGGSYDKRYFHFEVPGCEGYSCAEYLAGRGNIVLAADHLGVGESTRVPVQKQATRQVVAQAMDAASRQFHARLTDGTLHPSLPALPNLFRIGAGHSMGAMLTTIQQALFQTWDAIMFLGYTADGVHMTAQGRKFRAASLIEGATDFPDYTANDRAPLHEGFHWDDVPPDVIAVDDTLAVETPSEIGVISIRTGIIREEAARIAVPMFFSNGERDVSGDLHGEPHYFPDCPDFTLHLLTRSGHCHNFASTRHQQWDRMDRWAKSLR
ncbi:MAG: alpha/beta hydrolase, partial [Nevskiales bacterium]